MARPVGSKPVLLALLAALKGHPVVVRRVVFAAVMVSLGTVATSLATGWIINGALTYADASMLGVSLLGLAGVVLAQVFFEWYSGRLRMFLDASINLGTQGGLFSRLLGGSFLDASSQPVGGLILAFQGMRDGYEFLTQQVAQVAVALISAVVQVVALLLLAPAIGWAAVLAFLVLLISGGVIGRRVARAQAAALEAASESSTALADLLAGIQTVKASGLEVEAQGRWLAGMRSKLAMESRVRRLEMLGPAISRFVVGVFSALSLVMGIGQVMDGGMYFGTVLMGIFLGVTVLTAGESLARARTAYLGLLPRLAFTNGVLELVPEEYPQVPPAPDEEGWIVAENVWFRYRPDGPWVVKGLNLRVAPGQVVGIEGASGYGKSTTLRLLAGLLAPERGQVRVGGRIPAQAKEDLLYLPQFPQILSDSIRRNLSIFSAGADWARIEAAAKATGFEEIVRDLPLGFDTRLVAGGANLSGGQRQLLMLTACLASTRRIVLLDESMAGLDWIRRAAIGESPLLKEKTIIFASHDGAPV